MSDELKIRIHGDASLPALVYLPGMHGDWTLVSSFRAAVAGQARFVEFTYPRTTTWSLDDYARAVEERLSANGIQRGWLLGESFGSQPAWQLIARFLNRQVTSHEITAAPHPSPERGQPSGTPGVDSLSMNRPTPDPSQEGSRHPSASCPFPSWEGSGVGSWSQCMRKSERRLSMNRKVGQAARYLFNEIAARARGARTLVRRKLRWRTGLEFSQRGSAVPAFLWDQSRAPGEFLVGAVNPYDACATGQNGSWSQRGTEKPTRVVDRTKVGPSVYDPEVCSGFCPLGLILAGGFVRHPVNWAVRMAGRVSGAIPLGWVKRFCVAYARYAQFRHRHAPETLASIAEFVANRTIEADRRAIVHRYRIIADNDLRPVARQTALPVYYLAGLVDPLVPWCLVRWWLRRRCPGYRGGTMIWRADHNVLGTAPKASRDQILRWLNSG